MVHPEAEADLLRLIPYHRVGDPDDIANAVVAMASDLLDYVVGTTLYVDGGMTLFPGFATGADPACRTMSRPAGWSSSAAGSPGCSPPAPCGSHRWP